MEKRRLGRGLEALLGEADNATDAPVATDQTQLPLDRIHQNPFQPRKNFDPDELASLSDSVRSHGILQPLVVRVVDGGQYQLVAGERRLRAAQEAGLAMVPVRVVNFNDQEVLEAALIENIQRTDLNPIEKAQGFKDYLDRYGVSQEDLARRVGLARSTIANLVNLLELSSEVQDAVRVNQISEAHAKLLKGVKDHAQQIALCKQIIARGLSVKAAEQFLREQREEAAAATEAAAEPQAAPEEKTAHVKGIEDDLRQRFATRVEIKLRGKERGQIVLRFESNDDFMRILEVLRK
ncbi:MAG: ParB/RepB/Spo0J family partition protein [Gemmataceae bacterium]|nr:ParB/RepB/Spo0J family partition protein [Gemmataceae bacterium]